MIRLPWVRRSRYEYLVASRDKATATAFEEIAARKAAEAELATVRAERDEARAAHHRVRTEMAEATIRIEGSMSAADMLDRLKAQQPEQCKRCGGTGQELERNDTSGVWEPVDEPCYRCGGKGTVRPATLADTASLGDLRTAARAAGHDMSDNLSLLGPLPSPDDDPPRDAEDQERLDGYQAASDALVAGAPCSDCGGVMVFGQAHHCKPGAVS